MSRFVQISFVAFLVTAGALLLLPAAGLSAPLLQGAHAVSATMPKSCRACHSGMRMSISGEERVCLNCHGNDSRRDYMQSRGYLRLNSGARMADVGAVLKKPYRHPVAEVSGAHRRNEQLPEEQVGAGRHAECVDCHDPHQVAEGAPYRGIPGRRVVNTIVDLEYEYELCYRCHAESANLPGGSTNKHAEFKPTNRSFHPVEAEGANALVVSLKAPYAARAQSPGDVSVISCSDCHGNDDVNGPRGPHGSNFAGLLVENYEMRDGLSEGSYQYALCYRCHERASILGDESFPYHSLHITGGTGPGTSCFTCHDAHGSVQNTSLIRFNEEVVSPSAAGRLEYKTTTGVGRNGTCTLTCHGVEHDKRSY